MPVHSGRRGRAAQPNPTTPAYAHVSRAPFIRNRYSSPPPRHSHAIYRGNERDGGQRQLPSTIWPNWRVTPRGARRMRRREQSRSNQYSSLIVAWSLTAGRRRHAFLWIAGKMLDLNSLVTWQFAGFERSAIYRRSSVGNAMMLARPLLPLARRNATRRFVQIHTHDLLTLAINFKCP
jgi:hypothetical protein